YQALVYVQTPKEPVWDSYAKPATLNGSKLIKTSAGRILLNEALPKEIPYINYALTDKDIRSLIEYVYRTNGPFITVNML
ncbi:MAG: hypothetical protein RDU47_02090, partial [Spirochaetia bacterium]|nr:hypothetical protein [Spirochaetia bacterium]